MSSRYNVFFSLSIILLGKSIMKIQDWRGLGINKNEPHPLHFPRKLQHIHLMKLKEIKQDIQTRSNKNVKNNSPSHE